MNSFFFIILFVLVLEYILGIVSNLLNLKALKLEPPTTLKGVYKPDEYKKSQMYTRTITRFNLVTSTFCLLVLLIFWFAGGFNLLDQIVRSWGFISIVNGLLYIGIILLGYNLLMLPFSIYTTFVIEERFNFNRTTLRTFMLDRIKGLCLVVLIGTPLLASILALFEYAVDYAWLYCWIAVTVFSLILQFIIPKWIMPLFNKFTPLESGELKDAILDYANSVDFPVKNVFVMDGSKRSSKSNAFFTGIGRNKRIALYDTLIEKHTVSELIAVLAHEIGHQKKGHILQGIIIGIIHSGVLFFLLSIFLSSTNLYNAFYMEQQSIYSGILFFSLLYTPLEMLISIFLQALSRKNEYEADLFSARTVDNPDNMIDALKKLSADNLSNLTPHPFYVFMNYSHPPLLQRINAILQYEAQLHE